MDIKLQDKYGLYINGEWVDPKSEEWLESTNPANGNKLAKIANASEEDVDLAIDAATELFGMVDGKILLKRKELSYYLRLQIL